MAPELVGDDESSAALLKTRNESSDGDRDNDYASDSELKLPESSGEEYDSEEEEMMNDMSISSSSSSARFICELRDVKDAVGMALNRYTLIGATAAFLASYLSVVGLGPWVGPLAGPWLESKGYGSLAGPWANLGTSGHATSHTTEGELRSRHDMDGFAKRVRVLPEGLEVGRLKQNLMHLRSSVGLVTDEVHEDAPGAPMTGGHGSDSSGGGATAGAPLYYSAVPRTVTSNVTFGMNVPTHAVHGHSHMRLPRVWYDCLHVGISAWDLVETSAARDALALAQEAAGQGGNSNALRVVEAEQRAGEVAEANAAATEALRKIVEGPEFWPPPSAVEDWFGIHNKTGFQLEGLSLRFCPEHLGEQDALESGPGRGAYAKAVAEVSKLGRKFRQLAVVLWWAHKWGAGAVGDPTLHTSVLQEILPVASGLQSLRFSGVVHRANAPAPPLNAHVTHSPRHSRR